MNNITDKMKFLFFKISVIFIFFISIPLISANELYIENDHIFNLKNYRSNQIFSKTYYRNLISYYFYNKENHQDILDFLKKNQPEFFWLANELWQKNALDSNQRITNPALKVWDQFFRAHQEKEYNYKILKENCDYFGDLFCQWINDVEYLYINYYKNKQHVNYRDIYTILKKLEIYLLKSYYIPFMYETASWLPVYLRQIGLPLESSILIKQMSYNINPSKKQDLLQELIYSIFLAGDPDYAIEIFLNSNMKNLKYQSTYFNIFNILFLSKNYDFIINNLKNESFLNLLKNHKGLDVWTSFPLTNHLLNIRLVDFMYWKSKNEKEILVLIERLINNKELSELEKQYARLIQSRIIYNYNIELAQKIAEDVQFKSQEKALYLLEYYATIWNAWCLYKQKKYYLSNIEFTKANNIARRHFPSISRYSVYLGLFLTRQVFNIVDLNLIQEILNIENEYFPDSYFFNTIEWIPEDISYDIWKDIYVNFLISKKRYDLLIDFILIQYQRPWIFTQRKNSGSYIGLSTSYLYCKYIKCDYKYNIMINNKKTNPKVNLKNFNLNSVLLYQTENFYYAFVYNKNWTVYKKDKNRKLEILKDILNESKNNSLTFILNPNVNINHKEITEIFNNRAIFKMFYKDTKILKNLKDNMNIQTSCNLSNDEVFITLKNIKINYEYPFLTKFDCDSKTILRLWDLERFYNENKILLIDTLENFSELYQILYFTATYKNWLIFDITQESSIVPIDFIE